jgi:hypothetical protein
MKKAREINAKVSDNSIFLQKKTNGKAPSPSGRRLGQERRLKPIEH